MKFLAIFRATVKNVESPHWQRGNDPVGFARYPRIKDSIVIDPICMTLEHLGQVNVNEVTVKLRCNEDGSVGVSVMGEEGRTVPHLMVFLKPDAVRNAVGRLGQEGITTHCSNDGPYFAEQAGQIAPPAVLHLPLSNTFLSYSGSWLLRRSSRRPATPTFGLMALVPGYCQSKPI